MSTVKRKVAMMVAALTLTSFVGCGTDAENTAQKSDTSRKEEENGASDETAENGWEYEEDTITMLVDTDTTMAGIQAVCELAKEKLGITVEIETRVGGSDGRNIVKTRLASGDMADICCFNSGCLLEELNPEEYFIDISDESWTEKFEDTFRSAASVDGKLYGVPLTSTSAGLVLYNRDIYEEYQLEVPKTWEEFMKNCDILKEAGETALIGTFGTMWTAQVPYLGDNYNVIVQEPDFPKEFEAGRAKYATTPVARRSFEKLAETTEYYNEDYMATTYDDGCDMLVNGDGVHWIVLSQALSNIYELYGEEVNKIGGFAVPGDDAEHNGLTVWMPSALYGNKNSEHIDSVKRFLESYASDEALAAYSEQILPEGPYAIKGVELPENTYTAVQDMMTYYDSGNVGTAMEFLCSIKGANCGAICQECVSGQITGEEAAKKYDDDCRKQALQLGIQWE